MSDQDSTVDLGGYGAIPPSYGTDTITLSPSTYGVSSITVPTTITTTGTGGLTGSSGLYTTTVPNGGYTLASGAGTNFNWNTSTTGVYQTNTTVNIDKDGVSIREGADLVVNGRSLTKFMEGVEEHLAVLSPNPALEERWDKLKELRRQYIEMEKDILEKEKIMKILKG
jgi:hypothetical protein